MIPVLLDTVGLIATWDRNDQWHRQASDVFQQLLARRTLFVTTTFILLECANAASRRSYRASVTELRQGLANEGSLIFPTDEDWQSAWDEYGTGQPGSPGVVDLVSFRVMRKLGITDAFTNDFHFRNAGFNPLF